jgi:MFS family permease
LSELSTRGPAPVPAEDASDPDLKRNVTLLTLDGTFAAAGSAFYDSSTVLPALVSTLTDSKVVIGLVATVRTLGWFLPQLVVANLSAGLRYKRRLVIINSLLQRLGLIIMAAVIYFFAVTRPGLALGLFLPVLILASLSEGINGVPWTDAVVNTIPAERRGRLFGNQQVFGGLLAFLCGFLVRYILTVSDYPDGYVILLLCTCAGFLLSIIFFMGVREKPAVEPRPREPLGIYLKSLPAAWRNVPNFVGVMKARFCLAFIFLSQPFFVVHARLNLGMELGAVGLFVSGQMLGLLIGSAVAGHLSDRRGNRVVVIMALLTSFLAPASALLLTAVHVAGLPELAAAAYPLVYFFMGSTFGAGWIGFTNYVIEVAPRADRATYIGLSNTLMAPFALLGAVGGVLVTIIGYQAVFAISAGVGLLGLTLAYRLPEPRHPGAGVSLPVRSGRAIAPGR